MKRLDQGFKNVATYAAGMEQWVKKSLFGEPLQYTFVNDFAIADWIGGRNGVLDTYSRVKENWLDNYKAWTEVVIAVNMLAWAHNDLKEQGYEGRDAFIELKPRRDDDAVLSVHVDMKVHGASHHLGDVYHALDHAAGLLVQRDVLGPCSDGDLLRLGVPISQVLLLLLGEGDLGPTHTNGVFAVLQDELAIEQVHLGHANESCDKQVDGVVEHLLRCANLLHVAILHDDDAITKGHCLGLVMRDVDEGGVQTRPQLDNLGAHLVAELCVQV